MEHPAGPADLLRSGSTLGPYTILARIGSGGMGEVYRAHDARLDRDVAVKVLLPEVATHPERLARFEREARVLAALNHPRIAAIYGLEHVGATPALVMELVEGPTLADRMRRGPLPVDEAIHLGRQVAEGLEYAHEQGVVHRDLKPANLKLAADEDVKILDFGLAKALGADGSTASPSNSPTMTGIATQAGVILGTAAYMAPEQAKGKLVDRRADIWAFGCVLYEMLTGAPPFRGETVTDILAAVVREDPDWARLPASTSPALRHLLKRCLRKDVRQRLQAIGDARLALDEMAAGAEAGQELAVVSRRRAAWLVPGLAGAALMAAIASVVGWTLRPAPAVPRSVTRFTIALPPGQRVTGLDRAAIAFSSDGRDLAYVASAGPDATPQIYVRPLNALEANPIAPRSSRSPLLLENHT